MPPFDRFGAARPRLASPFTRIVKLFLPTALATLAACSDDSPAEAASGPSLAVTDNSTLVAEVRQLTAGRGITALERPPHVRPALVNLGQALAFDKVLSGNRDIACMTCHMPRFATGDARSLAVGQGATGLGPERSHPQGAFIPRNGPPLFNLFALAPLFWDGRIFRDETGAIRTPAGDQVTPDMVRVFEFGTLSALPLFPVLSRSEMRADAGNELAEVPDDQEPVVWARLMERLGRIRQYRRMFESAYPGQQFDQMTFAHASNAIAGFFVDRMSFTNTPWDRFLAGDDGALTPPASRCSRPIGARCAWSGTARNPPSASC